MPPRKTAKPPMIIVVGGPEEFLVREKLDELLREYVTDDARAFDYSEFRSTDVDAPTFWNALITLPLLAKRRVVVLHLQGEPKDELQRALTQYAAQPASATLLIIVQVTDSASPVKLSGEIETISCALLKKPAERAQWARNYAQRQGKELAADAAEYLVSTSPARLVDLAAKLDHAIIYAGDAREISAQDLLKVTGVSTEYLPWDLENAILERRPQRVLQIARSMEAGGEELLRLMAFQRGSLLQLWQIASEAPKSGRAKSDQKGQDSPEDKISAILGRKAWKSKDFRDAAAAIGEIRLRDAVVELLKLEVQLKSGRAGWPGYYEWIWRLFRTSKRPGTSFNL